MKVVYLLIIVGLITFVKPNGEFLLIERGINEYLQSHIKPEYLQNAIDSIFKVKNRPASNKAKCETCVIIADAVLKLRKTGASRKTVLEFLQNVCLWLIDTRRSFCYGYMDLKTDAALYIIDNNLQLTAEHVCGIVLQEYDCVDPQHDPWSIDIPPKLSEHKPLEHSNGEEEVVVHLTDFHYDPLYQPGANSECDFFICCQSTNEQAKNPADGAGYWGDYKPCNTPLHSIQNLLQQVVKQHPKIDRVYYTGDTASHIIWASSKAANLESLKTVTNELKNNFKSVSVFPVLGNHDAHPTDLFSFSNITNDALSTQWLLDAVAKEWSIWLPNDTQTTIRKGGYYTALVKPGLRIIGLNSNLCYTKNLWLIGDNKDPHGQLQWLVGTLAAAEKNKELVHILSHVPPGDKTCLRQWNHEYRRIIDRFSNTITGQFYGHTHTDELKIFYGLDNPNQVVNVAFVGGSVTTFTGLNPNYRIYNIDGTTWNVNDYEEWSFDLQEANKSPNQPPNWFKLYSFKDAYGLQKLDLSAYHVLLQKMVSNTSLIEQYRRFSVRDSPVYMEMPCGKECLSNLFCRISNVEFEDSMQCKAFKTKFYKI